MSEWVIKETCDYLDVPYLESFKYDAENRLTLICSFKSGNKKIYFDDHWVFRTIDEGKAFETLGEQNFDGKSWMFTATSSELIDWFNKQSSQLYKNEFHHFIIVTQHHIIEVLGDNFPQITSV